MKECPLCDKVKPKILGRFLSIPVATKRGYVLINIEHPLIDHEQLCKECEYKIIVDAVKGLEECLETY